MFQRFFRNRRGTGSGAWGGRGGGRGGRGGRGGTGLGRGGGGGDKPGSGPGGNCVCPKCGHKTAHQVGQRCNDQICPECGTRMTRE